MARILVAEDQPIIALSLAAWLADLGHVVVGPAATLALALELAEAPLEAAVMESRLGGQSTAPLASALMARGVALLVTTGHDPESLGPAFDGAALLLKPFPYEALRRKLALLLDLGPDD